MLRIIMDGDYVGRALEWREEPRSQLTIRFVLTGNDRDNLLSRAKTTPDEILLPRRRPRPIIQRLPRGIMGGIAIEGAHVYKSAILSGIMIHAEQGNRIEVELSYRYLEKSEEPHRTEASMDVVPERVLTWDDLGKLPGFMESLVGNHDQRD